MQPLTEPFIKISWYGLFCACQFGVLALIAWRLLSVTKKVWLQVILLILEGVLAFGLMGRELGYLQYKCDQWLVHGRGSILVSDNPRPETGAVFGESGSSRAGIDCVYDQNRSMYDASAFSGVSRSEPVVEGNKAFAGTNVRKYLMVAGSAFLGILILYSIDSFAYRSTEWKSFRAFFDARTNLYDFYGIPDYDRNEEFYQSIGLSRESYTLLQNYNFALDDSIDESLLERIAQYQRENAGKWRYVVPDGWICLQE